MSGPIAGKYLLEILTRGMYSNPLHIYREYVQNATDAIDAAVQATLIQPSEAAIHITVNPQNRSITIKDNGTGIPGKIASTLLLSVGASDKDGVQERGFRGIGRLGGLAYADEVQFVTSAAGEALKTIMTCDCVRLQELLKKSNTETADVLETFDAISSFDTETEDVDDHYFEVRLFGVDRGSGLLDEKSVKGYLSETAPVDFDDQAFIQADKIRSHYRDKGCEIRCYNILWGSRELPIRKLYTRSLAVGKQRRTRDTDGIRDVDLIYGTSEDGTPMYIGWLAITDFSGAVQDEALQGIRFRRHNILVGDNTTFTKYFNLSTHESQRANGVFAGEIHVLHPAIIPNSQRDDFEPGPEYSEMKKCLEQWANSINRKYRRGTSRTTSAIRKLTEAIDAQKDLEKRIDSGEISSDERRDQLTQELEEISNTMSKAHSKLRRAVESGKLDQDRAEHANRLLEESEKAAQEKVPLQNRITNAEYATKEDLNSSYSRQERRLYQRIIEIIDQFFADEPDTASALRAKLKEELNPRKTNKK